VRQGCKHITVIAINHRPGKAGVAARPMMPVIPTLDGERQLDADFTQDRGQPRSGADPDILGNHGPGTRFYTPLNARSLERPCIAADDFASQFNKASDISQCKASGLETLAMSGHRKGARAGRSAQ
jgi:hypothetical protein